MIGSCLAILFCSRASHRSVNLTHRIEVVVGQGNESETNLPQIDDLVDHTVMVSLPGLLAIDPPNAAKRAMLRASTNGLYRGPHVFIRRHQIASRNQELATLNPSVFLDFAQLAGEAIGHGLAPRNIAIALTTA
jgi:hypothetical protein